MNAIGFRIRTPLGTMRATLDRGCLRGLDFADDVEAGLPGDAGERALLQSLQQQMDEWWAGRRARFTLALAPCGTPFQQAVWTAVGAVPRGRVVSYGELAARLGRPGGPRAVGAALGKNPWLLVVPCHRVVAADGSLAGYAGGLERKRALLAAEGEGRGALRLPAPSA